jgi:hypothetical protein
MPFLDPYEVARQHPNHFWVRADNARYVAYCLWTLGHGTEEPIDPEAIGGEPSQARGALFEGWLRESSLSLELIIKAAFSQLEHGRDNPSSVPSTHHIPQLWKMAKLPRVSDDEEFVLYSAFQVLQWFGRYAAPRKGNSDLFRELDSLRPRRSIGDTKAMRLDWEGFDALYQIAEFAYFDRRRASEAN